MSKNTLTVRLLDVMQRDFFVNHFENSFGFHGVTAAADHKNDTMLHLSGHKDKVSDALSIIRRRSGVSGLNYANAHAALTHFE